MKNVNKLLTSLFEMMIKYKWVVCLILVLSSGYFAQKKLLETVIGIGIALSVSVIINAIVHDKEVVIPSVFFILYLFAFAGLIIKYDMVTKNEVIVLILSNTLCCWMTSLFINNDVNKRSKTDVDGLLLDVEFNECEYKIQLKTNEKNSAKQQIVYVKGLQYEYQKEKKDGETQEKENEVDFKDNERLMKMDLTIKSDRDRNDNA